MVGRGKRCYKRHRSLILLYTQIHTDSGNDIATVGISKQKEEHNDKQ